MEKVIEEPETVPDTEPRPVMPVPVSTIVAEPDSDEPL